MPDERTDHQYDIDPEIEALLAELTADDLDDAPPPPDVWAGIEARLAADEGRAAPVADLAARRRSRFQPSVLLAAAAALVLVVVGAAVVINRSAGDAVLATADLGYQDAPGFDAIGASASARAELVETDGGYEIVLDDATLPTDLGEPADLELWLIEADSSGNIVDIASVALVEGAGAYDVPSSIDVATHRIVDISIEPRDGDAGHSSRSIVRGVLAEA